MLFQKVYLLLMGAAAALACGCQEEAAPTWRTDRVRLAGVLKRKEGLTYEEFLTHWLSHGELFKTTNMSKSVLRYDEMPINGTISQMLKSTGALTFDGYDGIALFEGNSYDELLGVLSSPEHEEIIVPDEEKFLTRNATIIIPLNLATILDRDAE
ncbi:glyoxalase family protein [Moniliophthora roreri MCA 2997]|uniref:Glyoxalase family protein n=2 Tax=Moniliophthora roreri TaxID=221103 RepID=V2WS19_MONRO|nr:glyoxalase family protein [Moniliophthora roreri MCA 2997]KAI3604529.1 glyoxalase family protein [Moniliophthora roreri]